jgi:hypothetical protein
LAGVVVDGAVVAGAAVAGAVCAHAAAAHMTNATASKIEMLVFISFFQLRFVYQYHYITRL